MTPSPRTIETITTMLQHHTELTDPGGRTGEPGTGDRVKLMPHDHGCHVTDWNPPLCTCSRRSVIELERLLRTMREDRAAPLVRLPNGTKASVRSLWWNLNARYIACDTVLRDIPVSVRGRNGKRTTKLERRRVAITTPGIDPTKIAAGIAWIATNWDPYTPIELPSTKHDRAQIAA